MFCDRSGLWGILARELPLPDFHANIFGVDFADPGSVAWSSRFRSVKEKRARGGNADGLAGAYRGVITAKKALKWLYKAQILFVQIRVWPSQTQS